MALLNREYHPKSPTGFALICWIIFCIAILTSRTSEAATVYDSTDIPGCTPAEVDQINACYSGAPTFFQTDQMRTSVSGTYYALKSRLPFYWLPPNLTATANAQQIWNTFSQICSQVNQTFACFSGLAQSASPSCQVSAQDMIGLNIVYYNGVKGAMCGTNTMNWETQNFACLIGLDTSGNLQATADQCENNATIAAQAQALTSKVASIQKQVIATKTGDQSNSADYDDYSYTICPMKWKLQCTVPIFNACGGAAALTTVQQQIESMDNALTANSYGLSPGTTNCNFQNL